MPLDTLEEIIAAIDRNPELRKQLRDRILGDEFLELPAQVAALTATVNELAITLNEFMETTNKRFDEIDKRLDVIDKRLDEHDERFDAIDKRFDEIDERFDAIDKRFDEHDNRFDRVEGQIARVYDKLNAEFGGAKGRDFENKVMERAFLIPESLRPGLMHVKNLEPSELRTLAGPASNISDIPRGHRDSYYFADLVMEASTDDGETCYIAAEISYTCDEGDTERAIRNAGMLERFTGKRSYAAVVGVSLDDRIRATIDSGAVHWHKLEEGLVMAK